MCCVVLNTHVVSGRIEAFRTLIFDLKVLQRGTREKGILSLLFSVCWTAPPTI